MEQKTKKERFLFIKNLFSDSNNVSMLRFLCFFTCGTGIYVTVMAIRKMMITPNLIDVGGNIVALILGLFGLAITGKFTQKIFEKNTQISKEDPETNTENKE